MKSYPLASLILITLLSTVFAENNVFLQNVHTDPKTPYEDPEDFLKITINEKSYRSSSMKDWKLLPNLYSMDMVALHPESLPGYIGLRVETLSPGTQPIPTTLNLELLDQYVLKLFPIGSNWDEVRKTLKDFQESAEFHLTRTENNSTLQTHLKFTIAKNEIWIMVCESTPQNFSHFEPHFSSFAGTFGKDGDQKSEPISSETAKLDTAPIP